MTFNRKHNKWTFTEWECADLHTALLVSGLPEGVMFMVYNLEKTKTSGRHHLQGLCVLNDSQTLKWMRHNVSHTCHWEPMKKDLATNLRYCTKELTRLKDNLGPYYWGITEYAALKMAKPKDTWKVLLDK